MYLGGSRKQPRLTDRLTDIIATSLTSLARQTQLLRSDVISKRIIYTQPIIIIIIIIIRDGPTNAPRFFVETYAA